MSVEGRADTAREPTERATPVGGATRHLRSGAGVSGAGGASLPLARSGVAMAPPLGEGTAHLVPNKHYSNPGVAPWVFLWCDAPHNMSKPTKWRQLAATAETIDGVLHSSIHMLELESGKDFVVTLSGEPHANAGYFIGALLAVAKSMQTACGMTEDLPLVTNETRPNTH